jgi:hypothetical protein
METNNFKETNASRFNVVIRVRPELGDEKTDITTEDDMYPCVSKLVNINLF